MNRERGDGRSSSSSRRALEALDPRRLDVADAARRGLSLSGAWPLAGFERLAEDAPAAESTAGTETAAVEWAAEARAVPTRGGEPALWLQLRAQATVSLVCQRCLQPVALALSVDRDIRFARDDAHAAALDAELEEDVLPLTRTLDLHELVEDELLLALPIVPRHERCPEPVRLAWPTADEIAGGVAGEAGLSLAQGEAVADRPNPFAVLEALKRRPS